MRHDLILIASADRCWGLGKDNKLLKRIPEDLKRFSEMTSGNVIIVGRKTMESFKDKKPLPRRLNIVMTKDRNYTCEGAFIVHSLQELFGYIEDREEKVFVCGGESVYSQLLPYCRQALITQIDEAFKADTFLTNLDNAPEWKRIYEGEWQHSSAGVKFRYVDYCRICE